MKAALFTLASHRLTQRGVLALRAAALEGAHGAVSLLVGLPGTGKSSLAIGGAQRLLADDAIAWTDRGMFPLEGGCYPRCHGLSLAEQPVLGAAIRFGALLENAVVDPHTRLPDYRDTTHTENIRSAFPLEHVPGTNPSLIPRHPTNVILLTCDATGVLPPVSRLSPEQAAYYYLNGYSSKLSTTASGSAETVFSPCYSAGLLVQSPEQSLEHFVERLRTHAPQAWLVNTGWSGSPDNAENRIALAHSHAIVAAIASQAFDGQPMRTDPVFGSEVPAIVEGVPSGLLHPWETWQSVDSYRAAALRLAEQFQANFQQYGDWVSPEVAAAGPRVSEVAAT